MALSITDLINAATPADFEAKILSVGATVGLSTTTWQVGGVTRTIVKLLAQLLGVAAGTSTQTTQLAGLGIDGLIATIAQGGFLDFAANVTPDPSVANPDGSFPPAGNGWLDILADSVYNVQRPLAVAASGPVLLTNTTGTTYGPFAVGTYHLINVSTKQTYSNSAVLTIGPSGDTSGSFVADVAGAAGTTVASSLSPVTSLVGVTVKTAGGANANSLTGSNAQSNATLVANCRGKLQALGPKLGPGGAYVYFATLPGYTGAALTGAAINRVKVVTTPTTGVVQVYLANGNGCSVGYLPTGDVAAVNAFIQSTCVPDGVTAVVQRAVEVDVGVTLDVYVPTTNVGTATVDVAAAVTAYINALPIGGAVVTDTTKGVPLDALIAAVFKAVPYLQDIENAQLNGSATDVVFGAASVCAMAVPGPIVTVHATG